MQICFGIGSLIGAALALMPMTLPETVDAHSSIYIQAEPEQINAALRANPSLLTVTINGRPIETDMHLEPLVGGHRVRLIAEIDIAADPISRLKNRRLEDRLETTLRATLERLNTKSVSL